MVSTWPEDSQGTKEPLTPFAGLLAFESHLQGLWGMHTLMCLSLNTHRASQTLSTRISLNPAFLEMPRDAHMPHESILVDAEPISNPIMQGQGYRLSPCNQLLQVAATPLHTWTQSFPKAQPRPG